MCTPLCHFNLNRHTDEYNIFRLATSKRLLLKGPVCRKSNTNNMLVNVFVLTNHP